MLGAEVLFEQEPYANDNGCDYAEGNDHDVKLGRPVSDGGLACRFGEVPGDCTVQVSLIVPDWEKTRWFGQIHTKSLWQPAGS